MMSSIICRCVTFLFWASATAEAQVLLNEASAATWERAVYWENGVEKQGAGPAWFAPAFVPGSNWSDGALPFSFSTGPQAAILQEKMLERWPTLYARTTFTATPAQSSSSGPLMLNISAMDGYVVYLNGREVARAALGTPGSWVYHDQHAFHPRPLTSESLNLGAASQHLVNGTNTLAVFHANDSTDGSKRYSKQILDHTSIHFSASLQLSGTALPLTNSWKYLVGAYEPSGGLYDPLDLDADLIEHRILPKYVDWVELRNTTGSAVSLAGWKLTDEASVPTKWTFPAGTTIAANGYLIVACSGRNSVNFVTGRMLHTNFSLDDRGEYLALRRPDGAIASVWSGIAQQEARYTWGQAQDGSTQGYLSPTPGFANGPAVFTGRVAQPKVSPETGVYGTSPTVTFTAVEPNATLRYTLDGSEPTASSPSITGNSLTLPNSTFAPGQGFCRREIWNPMPADSGLDDLPLATPPSVTLIVPGIEAPSYPANNFGERLSGLITAPVTGQYRFYISADDEGRFMLSNNATAAGLQQIAYCDFATMRDYLQSPVQQSAPVSLVAGQQYYFEAYNYEYDGDSGLSIGWLPPGAGQPEVVPASAIKPPAGVALPTLSYPRATTLRVRAFASGKHPSDITTRTYATGLTEQMAALPAVFLSGSAQTTFYGLSGIFGKRGGRYEQLDPASPEDFTWRAVDLKNDFNTALAFGQPYERVGALEVLLPNNTVAGRTGTGMRFAGSGFSRPNYRFLGLQDTPWTADWRYKPQINLFFRGPLGEKNFRAPGLLPSSPLKEWDSLRLRAGRSADNITLVIDELARRTFAAMGNAAVQGRPVTVFINGHLKSFFLLVERPREAWFQEYFQLENAPFHVRVTDDTESGSEQDYMAMFATVKATDASTASGYNLLKSLWDMKNVADYAILNSYLASADFVYPDSDQNFVAYRQESPGAPWRFSVWDAESSFATEEGFTIQTNWTQAVLLDATQPFASEKSVIRTVFRRAYQNAEFRQLFADRVQRAFFQGGPLSKARLLASVTELNTPLAAAQQSWLGTTPEIALVNNWINQRQDIQLPQWAALGLWPTTTTPNATPASGTIPAGQRVTLGHANGTGTLYYTVDGTDPRLAGGAVAATAQTYSSGILIPKATVLKARVLKSGIWSPLFEANYAPPPPQLAITELHYNPDGSTDASEFIEITNLGSTAAALDGMRFTDGVRFDFPSLNLGAGSRAIIVKDPAAFALAFPNVPIIGSYLGELDNNGETLTVVDLTGQTVLSLTYGDDKTPGWPKLADGKGPSLQLRAGGRINLGTGAAAWRDSFGAPTPGGADYRFFSGTATADADRDGQAALIEHFFGSSDTNPQQRGHIQVEASTGGSSVEILQDLRAEDVSVTVLHSSNLKTWTSLPLASQELQSNSYNLRTYECPPGGRGYVRVQVTRL